MIYYCKFDFNLNYNTILKLPTLIVLPSEIKKGLISAKNEYD